MQRHKKKLYIKYAVIILICIISLFLIAKFKFMREIVGVLISSFIVAYTLKPINRKMISKFNINKRLSAFILIIGVLALFIGIFTILIPSIFKEAISLESIIVALEEIVELIVSKINIPKEEFYSIINEQFGEKINLMISGLTEKIFTAIINFSENIVAFAIIPIASYYLLADGELIANKMLLLFSADKRILIKNIASDIDKVLGKYIIGQLFLCIVVGFMTAIGLLIIDIKFILILSILNGILNIVPYFGAILGMVPALIIALMDEPIKMVYVLLMFIIIQQLEGNIIAPKVTANSIKMHPLMVILLLLIGEKIAGLVGMIFIVPIGVIIKIIYEDIDYYLF